MKELKTQPQVAQLDLQFEGPLVKDSIVDTKNDLTMFQTNYAYKMVWVKDESCYYYLKEGNSGKYTNHWIKYGSTAVQLFKHDPSISYTKNSCVYDNNGIYISSNDVPIDTEIDGTYILNGSNLPYWRKVSDTIKSIKQSFYNQSSVYIDIPTGFDNLENPVFQVFIDNKVVFPGIEVVDPINNQWKISFYEDGVLTPKTGYVIVK